MYPVDKTILWFYVKLSIKLPIFGFGLKAYGLVFPPLQGGAGVLAHLRFRLGGGPRDLAPHGRSAEPRLRAQDGGGEIHCHSGYLGGFWGMGHLRWP